jgi:hypothetical protein
MPYFFSRQSADKLKTCDKRLQKLFNTVILHRDCSVIWGHRGEKAQNKAYKRGNSKVQWPNSNHNRRPSGAVDVMPYPIDWGDRERLVDFANFVEGVAAGLGIKVKWGGRWENFFDGAHWELKN